MIERIVLYGAGERCRKLIEATQYEGIDILAIIDADQRKVGNSICGYIIEPLETLRKFNREKICNTIHSYRICIPVETQLIEDYGYKEENIIPYDYFFVETLKHNLELRNTIYESIKDKANIDDISDPPVYFGLLSGMVLGGVEERVKQLCAALINSGKKNTYIISKHEDAYFDVSKMIEDHIIKADIQTDKKENIIILAKLISELCPCIIVTNQPDELLMAAYIVKSVDSQKIRIISIISGSLDFIHRLYLNNPYRSDMYIGVSDDIKSHFISKGIINTVSMKVPFPCDKNLHRGYSLEKKEALRIGYAGRLDGFEHSQKRMDLLIRVIHDLHDQRINFFFEIVGEGPAENEMKSYFERYGLNQHVSFLGRIPKEKVKEFWKQQDIGINVADYEGRSISVVEMMGGGAVPIVTDTSGVREDIEDGKNGYIVPIGDYKLVVERIVFLSMHRNDIERMGRQAHRDIWPKSRMDKHLEFWKSVICDKG